LDGGAFVLPPIATADLGAPLGLFAEPCHCFRVPKAGTAEYRVAGAAAIGVPWAVMVAIGAVLIAVLFEAAHHMGLGLVTAEGAFSVFHGFTTGAQTQPFCRTLI
jgi:hypothetical protein